MGLYVFGFKAVWCASLNLQSFHQSVWKCGNDMTRMSNSDNRKEKKRERERDELSSARHMNVDFTSPIKPLGMMMHFISS